MEKTHYKRNLPHIQPPDGVFNICFRLCNSLPKEKWLSLKEQRDFKIKEIKEVIKDPLMAKSAIRSERINYFGKYDSLLDSNDFGPTHLKSPPIAQVVYDCLLYWHNQKRYKLICFCIMPNHVHLILYQIQKPLFRILQSIKIYTAKKANLILNNKGTPFWHPESYDNLVRDRDDLRFKVEYVLQNPVKAHLVKHWADWDFTWPNPAFNDFTRNSDC